jgi:translation initiation factor IF-3
MIRAREVRVIGQEGGQLGIMAAQEAIQLAEEQGLDLVEVAPEARPPVCRIMDYGKYKYQQSKRLQQAKKKQKLSLSKRSNCDQRQRNTTISLKPSMFAVFYKMATRQR